MSISAIEYAREIRYARLKAIRTGMTPTGAPEGPVIVLHVLPCKYGPDVPPLNLDVSAVAPGDLIPMNSGGSNPGRQFNFDGVWKAHDYGNGKWSYALLFRSGIVEAASTTMFANWPNSPAAIASQVVVDEVTDFLQRSLALLSRMQAPTPVAIMLSLLQVKACWLAVDSRMQAYDPGRVIDRDDLVFPEIVSADFEATDVQVLLKPVFDQLWNAAGYATRTVRQ
jgi:hypothetical protein